MIDTVHLSPFNNILPHCPYCGNLPVIKPCQHLKSFIIGQEPDDGDSELIYLSDDFMHHLKNGLGVDIRLDVDENRPLPESKLYERKLYENYYFHDAGEMDGSYHLVDLVNSFMGAITFQQTVCEANRLERFITFAYSEQEYEDYNQFEIVQKKRSEQTSKNTIEKYITYKSDAEIYLELEESEIIEFKQTFSMDTRTNKKSDDIRFAALREIVGFLNTSGGQLLIGIHDKNKEILGIKDDGFDGDIDKYSRLIMDVVASSCGETAASLVQVAFETYGAKTVCVITCKKSDEPIYCKYKNTPKTPYVRRGSSTTQPDYEEWDKWRKQHFSSKATHTVK